MFQTTISREKLHTKEEDKFLRHKCGEECHQKREDGAKVKASGAKDSKAGELFSSLLPTSLPFLDLHSSLKTLIFVFFAILSNFDNSSPDN